MEQYHGGKLKKKSTGGKKRKIRDKKLCHVGGHFSATKIAEGKKKTERKIKRKRGGKKKQSLRYAEFANIVMPDKSMKRAKILNVVESPNNRHFTRMNIITKGVTIDTEVGKARVTSRVGQHGIVNAVLLTSKEYTKE